MIKYHIAILALFISVLGYAQKTNSSPYSFFGIGDQSNLKSVEEIGMGNVGGVLNSEYQLSFTNPASYASLLWTTYVFSGGNRWTFFDDGQNTDNSSHASLTYLAMGVPIKANQQGMVFGLQLNTSVGYSLLDTNFEDDLLVETNLLEGDGGTNRAFLGYGYQFPFNLRIGAEAAYIFGKLNNSVLNRRLNVQYATKYETDANVKGFAFKVGAQYDHKLTDKLDVKVGSSFDLSYDLDQTGEAYLISLLNVGDGSVSARDTLYNNSINSMVSYPLKSVLSVGMGEKNKWFVGAEYTFMDAIDLDDQIEGVERTYNYSESSMISLGGFYTPKFNSISNYFERVTYRAGFNYKKIGLEVYDSEIDDIGMSFGVSLPMGYKWSNVNLGVELGKRGETTGNLVEENYFNFRLSLSLNDKWFDKRKLN